MVKVQKDKKQDLYLTQINIIYQEINLENLTIMNSKCSSSNIQF